MKLPNKMRYIDNLNPSLAAEYHRNVHLKLTKLLSPWSSLKQGSGIDRLSIKRLTLLGFTLVALPLVLALLYAAMQINSLSKQSAAAIYDVAELTRNNRELSSAQSNMERYASQYLVLQEPMLLQRYLQQQQLATQLLDQEQANYSDDQLQQLLKQFRHITAQINQLIDAQSQTKNQLEPLQQQFKQLASTGRALNQRSEQLITNQANAIKLAADQLRNVMLNSLMIIPLTLVIAAAFVLLITTPLKRLTRQIRVLEQGKFEHKITLSGSPEIREIAEALDVMRTRLHALELQKSSVLRHISHELKTPLAAIREGTELLYDHSVGRLNEEQQEICQIIKSSVQRLQRLIEDLLNFNIVLDSTSLQDSEKLALAPLIDKVLSERKLDIKRKQLTIDRQQDNIGLHCNSKQLSVIIDNLLSNAIKYSPQQGHIAINASVHEQQLQLTVSDQGPGMPADIQAQVFDAFFQGSAPEQHNIKGSGLGLTIVQELLLRLNGSITLYSEPGQGCRMTIQLPRAYIVNGSH